jgi:arylsulfatase A
MKLHSYFPAILFAIVSLSYVHAQPAQKPNVIFILADDIGYDVLTVNEGQSYSTPNLDSMARHGKNFTHCESTPLCNPSRMMLLTGKQNLRNYSNWGYISDTAKTIGNLMQDAGYKTAFYGKLQLQCSPARMQYWGWDRYTIFEITDDTINAERRYKSPTLVDNKGRVPDSIVKNKYCDDILTTRILNFIDNNKSQPFFIYYSMSLCHPPFSPTPDDPQYAGWNPDKSESDTSFFPGMVKYMDKKVGQILNKLKSVGLDTNTIVLFAGDNGTPSPIHYQASGQRKHGEKGFTLEGGTYVPLIAYMPTYIAANTKNDDLIDFTDFFPTFAGLAHYRNLNKYGVLDGVSFYKRLFGKQDSVRSYLFSHYNPNPGYKSVFRWVRNKVYKLYDTSESTKYGKFYNIKTDPEENHPLEDSKLTSSERTLKANFRNILSTTPTWHAGPVVNNAAVLQVTSTSATMRAIIVNSGASRLIERGSTLSPSDTAFYRLSHLPDSFIALGTFYQTRNQLLAQKKYYYSMYAMNANPANSTGYAFGTFYTLSRPPRKQPTTLTATASPCSVKLNWNNAGFSTSGATKAGYLLFYSAKSIVLNSSANGKAPSHVTTDPNTRMVNLQSSLPALPAITATINGLSPDTLYYFNLIPYTWNGTNSATYNYLTMGALTTTKKPNSCSAPLLAENVIPYTVAGVITPNPSSSAFTLKMDRSLANELVRIRVCDVVGRVYINTEISGGSNYTFGEDLKPGVYMVYFNAGNKDYKFRIIKE